MKYDFDQRLDRRSTDSTKWRKYDEDVLPMWVADMDFMSPEPVMRALQERVAHGVFGYLDNSLPEIRQVFVQRLAELYHWEIQSEDVIIMPGVITGFNLACHTLGQPGSGILLQTPAYHPFLRAPENANRFRQDVELLRNAEGDYSIDWEGFERAITKQTGLFISCNPHNPVGRVFRQDELERLAEICIRRGVVICSDEIHCDLVYQGHPHIPIASLAPDIAANTITLMAPSKTYNLAGLKFSVAIIQNADLRRKFQRAEKGLVSSVNLMGPVAALAAYRDGGDWLDQLLVYLEANRNYLYEYVKNELPGISMVLPEGTYLAWLDCREAGIEGSPCEFFLERARVGLNDGVIFGKGGEGFVRLNFGCPRAVLTEALQRMKQALQVK
jgi:cystathionine beta-lyase